MSTRKNIKSLPRRYTKFDIKAQHKFLKQLELSGNLEASARSVSITPQTIYKHMRMSPLFKEAVENARARLVTEAENALRQRAIEGVDKGIYFKGELVAVEKQYSDQLLLELLKANHPSKYGRKEATLNINQNVVIEDKTKNRLASLLGMEDILDVEFTEQEQLT